MKDRLIKINDYLWKLPRHDLMRTEGLIFTSEKLLREVEEETITQVKNVASLPGIVGRAMAMPDMHYGYGFPIGGVAAFDIDKGIITPGGIGFDINCGVRLLSSNLKVEQIKDKLPELLDVLFRDVPSGVGRDSDIRISDDDYEMVLERGAEWAVEQGYGTEKDLEFCEEHGSMQGGNATKVSARAKARGRKQLGTLGAGNHFLEIQYVEEVYDEEIARVFDADVNQVMIMIHCGSRGLGHQVCSDYLRKMEDAFPDIMQKLPEKDLIYAPLSTALAQDYFQAMVCAANFAWANRHIIAHFVRNGFRKVLPESELTLVYDVAHNIAKKEEHVVDGTKRELLVHRKGATRAFPPGHSQIPSKYRKIGQPVLIPGSMGTSSYVLVGTSEGMSISMGSAPHGAGRLMSRKAALKKFRGSDIKQQLASQKILVKAASMRGISEEAPQCYKEIDEVIKVAMKTGIAKPVLKLRPLGVIKG